MHIGPQFVVLETAARHRAAEVAGTERLHGVSSHVMFVARGKAGPFRVEPEAMPGSAGSLAVRVKMYDEGAGHRMTTVGSYFFGRAG